MRVITLPVMFLCTAAISSVVHADTWADRLVVTKKVDFGVIATGSEARKVVEIKNIYDQSVHIHSATTTCGCSIPTLKKQTLRPGESGVVEVKMNTSKFRKKKDPWLIIKFDSPRYAEVRVPISAYIRTDVVFTPGMIRFGNVDFGAGGTAKVDIAYAGRPNWDIDDIRITNPHLKATLTPRPGSPGRINYELSMSLNEGAPAGPIRDLVQIVTNDGTNPYVPLMVEGVIVPDITITPSTVPIRPVAAGGKTRVQVVVKGKKPFKIDDVDCEGMADCFKAALTEKTSTVHLVPIEFVAPNRPGRFQEKLLVKINGRPEPLHFSVTGTITAN